MSMIDIGKKQKQIVDIFFLNKQKLRKKYQILVKFQNLIKLVKQN